MVANLKKANVLASKAAELMDKMNLTPLELVQKPSTNQPSATLLEQDLNSASRSAEAKESNNQFCGSNNFNSRDVFTTFPKRKIFASSLETDAVLKRIDKTLSKIKQAENSDLYMDSEFGIYLGEQLKSITEKFKELSTEFNVQHMQDQFSEYSSITLKKLEILAQKSRDAVLSAEAQISTYREHLKNRSLKLKDTEELLRASIKECLTLKHQLQRDKMKNAKFYEEVQEKLQKATNSDDLETAVKYIISSANSLQETHSPEPPQLYGLFGEPKKVDRATSAGFQKARSDEGETLVKKVYSVETSSGSVRSDSPVECIYCKQGSSHKLCVEKAKDLTANNRKLATELKLLQRDMKEERKLSRMYQEQVTITTRECEHLRKELDAHETRNASLLEQLKLEKSRLKKTEKFHNFQMAGLKTDIQNLKTKIQGLEKQLLKAVLIFEHNKNEAEVLKSVHATAQNSKQAIEALKGLKRKIYEIETDIKNL